MITSTNHTTELTNITKQQKALPNKKKGLGNDAAQKRSPNKAPTPQKYVTDPKNIRKKIMTSFVLYLAKKRNKVYVFFIACRNFLFCPNGILFSH